MNTHQFNNEPFRILLASLASGYQATDGFLASTLSKHLLRELKASDTALKNPESLRWNPVLKRYGTNAKADDDDEADNKEKRPKRLSCFAGEDGSKEMDFLLLLPERA